MTAKRPWNLPERCVTPESAYLNRRSLLAGATGAAAATLLPPVSRARAEADPSAGLYPAPLNGRFADAGRAVTPEAINTSYNNFYEFGTSKDIAAAAEALQVRPWTIAIDGLVETPRTLGIDDLLRTVTLEERIYRHRCVEAWSMVAPWTGFAEEMNDLPLMVTGAYGKPLPNSMGAPLRLHLPWKYGFKSIKGIVRVSFTSERPVSFWETLGPSEYGFWANVNPDVAHPRWSQATEQVLGTDERIPTLLYNGYGEQVASLYAGLENEKLYM